MSLPSHTSISVRACETQWRFQWCGFDGDDSFGSFRVTVAENGQEREFDFGPCVVRAVRKLREFFRGGGQDTVGGGFRNPDIRYYDVYRVAAGQYRLVIRFEGSGLHEEFHLKEPNLNLDPEYLRFYDGEKT